MHTRKIYNFFDWIGAIGGSFSFIIAFCGMLVGDIPKKSYYLKAISKLLLIWPYDDLILKEPNQNPRSQNQALAHYKLQQGKRFSYLCYQKFSCLFCCEGKESKDSLNNMNRIVETGSRKVDQLFNIVKMANDLRDAKFSVISAKGKKKYELDCAQNPKRVLRVDHIDSTIKAEK